MTIEVTFDGGDRKCFPTLDEAKEAILEHHANGIGVDRIVEIDDDNEEVAEYGCSWSLELEEF